MRMHRSRRGGVSFRMATLGAVAVLGLGAVACGDDEESSGGGGGGSAESSEEPVTVGLITKTETNPFFVKMKEAAQAAAKENNVELLAQIPIEMEIREGGDSGMPMSVAQPQSTTAREFMALAEKVATQLAAQAVAKPRKPTIMLKTV